MREERRKRVSGRGNRSRVPLVSRLFLKSGREESPVSERGATRSRGRGRLLATTRPLAPRLGPPLLASCRPTTVSVCFRALVCTSSAATVALPPLLLYLLRPIRTYIRTLVLAFSLSLALSLRLFFFLSLARFISFSFSLSLASSLSLSLALSLSRFVSFSLLLARFLASSIFLSFFLARSLASSLSLSCLLALSLRLFLFLSLGRSLACSFSLSLARSLVSSLSLSLSRSFSLALEPSLVEATTWRPFGTVRWGRARGRHLLRAALYARRNFTTAGAFIAIRGILVDRCGIPEGCGWNFSAPWQR